MYHSHDLILQAGFSFCFLLSSGKFKNLHFMNWPQAKESPSSFAFWQFLFKVSSFRFPFIVVIIYGKFDLTTYYRLFLYKIDKTDSFILIF